MVGALRDQGGIHSSSPGWRWRCGVQQGCWRQGEGLELRHALKEKMTDVIASLDKDEGIKGDAWIVAGATDKWRHHFQRGECDKTKSFSCRWSPRWLLKSEMCLILLNCRGLRGGERAMMCKLVFALGKVNACIWCGMSVYAYQCLCFG